MVRHQQTFYAILSERAVLEQPFRHFNKLNNRAGQLGFSLLDIPRMRPDLARDATVKEFMRLSKDPDDTLVMLDVDHMHGETIIEELVADDKPVVAALAFRADPTQPDPCWWARDQNGVLRTPRAWERGLVRASVVGTGAIAIKRSVFTALENEGFNLGFFKYQYHANGTSSSEEIFFSQIVEQVGIEVYVDTRIVTPHHANAQIDESSWEEWCADNPLEKREHKVSVIIPQKGRFEKLKVCLESLKRTAPEAEVILVTDIDESDALDEAGVIPDGVKRFCLGLTPRGAIEKWNHGTLLASGDVIVCAANDVEFGDKWLEYALDALDSINDGNAMVAFNDSVTDPEVSSPHFLMTREYIVKYNGGVLMPPVYKKQFPDVENRLRAQSLGRYVCAKASIVKHLHPLTNTAPMDDVYKMGLDTFEEDQRLCQERQKAGFEITWEPVLK